MAGNPRIVTEDTAFTWDHASQRLARGTVIDVPADSALERAIGQDRLVPLAAAAPQPALAPGEAPAAEEPQDAPEAEGDAVPQPSARSKRSTAQAGADGEPGAEAAGAGAGDAM